MACPGGEFPIFKFDIYSGRRGYLTFTRKQYAKTEIGFRKLSENPTLEMTQDRFKMTILSHFKIFRENCELVQTPFWENPNRSSVCVTSDPLNNRKMVIFVEKSTLARKCSLMQEFLENIRNQMDPPEWMLCSWILKCELKLNYKDNITTLKGSTLPFVSDSFDFYFFMNFATKINQKGITQILVARCISTQMFYLDVLSELKLKNF